MSLSLSLNYACLHALVNEFICHCRLNNVLNEMITLILLSLLMMSFSTGTRLDRVGVIGPDPD